jgi:hypothetical protein
LYFFQFLFFFLRIFDFIITPPTFWILLRFFILFYQSILLPLFLNLFNFVLLWSLPTKIIFLFQNRAHYQLFNLCFHLVIFYLRFLFILDFFFAFALLALSLLPLITLTVFFIFVCNCCLAIYSIISIYLYCNWFFGIALLFLIFYLFIVFFTIWNHLYLLFAMIRVKLRGIEILFPLVFR